MLFIIRLLTVACILVLRAPPADARRVALVIGNADYMIGPLANPVRDAEAVAEVLEKQLSFDKIILGRNLKADAFRAALLELSRESAGAEVAAVFFAGHGTEVNGKNYLIPVDAKLAKSGDLGLEAIPLDLVLEQLAGATRLKLVILDACRNNLFPMAGAKRAVTRGLSRIEPEDNTLVVYAAKDGTTADDGTGQTHSPFTAALLKHIATPGLEVSFVFRRVRDDVVAATKALQTPHTYGTLGGAELYLKPLAVVPPGATPSPPSGPSPTEVAQFCQSVAANASLAVVEALLAVNRGTPMAPCIEARIAELRKLTAVSQLQAPPKVPTTAPQKSPKVADADYSDPLMSPGPGLGLSPFGPLLAPDTSKEEDAVLKRWHDLRLKHLERKDETSPAPTIATDGPLPPGSSFRDCAECPEMVVMPAGSFMMGSPPGEQDRQADEGPQHWVTIKQPFAVGKFEVTFEEWEACVTAGACTHRPDDQGWGRGKHPVINVSWDDITRQYLPWLSSKTGKTYRLLTEAEWEYAAWAGTTTRYAFGTTISKSQAQHSEGGKGSAGKTVVVGSFQPNDYGLHDMHGNAWEWVQDCWNGSYSGAPSNGSAWTSGDCSRRALRGGAWNSVPWYLRSASRLGYTTVNRAFDLGFRVGRSI